MKYRDILDKVPYSTPFLFVDEITDVSENSIEGNFTFVESLDFYRGHFKENPVTPGVILTEVMAQIGVVCLGIYLSGNDAPSSRIAMSSTDVTFLKPVFPGEKVTVQSQKVYFRFGKLKCKVSMRNESGEEVCFGSIAGIVTH